MTYPNVLVMGYLRATGQLTPEAQMKLEHAINLGYQRLLTFECLTGGFDWFGHPPGKTILSAYGLLELSDMAKVYDVDPAFIARVASWLRKQQAGDGSFAAEGCPHSWTAGGDATLAATAYVAWALLEADPHDAAAGQAVAWLRAHAADAQDPYTLALVANAFVAWNRDQSFTRAALDRLAQAARKDKDDAWWSTAMQGFTWSRGTSADVEATALAAYALLRGSGDPALVDGALGWIARQKSERGDWGSTQATILAIKALLAAARTGSGGLHGKVTVQAALNGQPPVALVFEEGKSDYLRQVSFKGKARPGANRLHLAVDAPAHLGWQVVGRAYVPGRAAPAAESPLDLVLKFDRTTLATDDHVRAEVTLRYRNPSPTYMVIVDLGIPPGFEPEAGDLQELVEKGKIEKFSLTGRQVTVYVGSLASDTPVTFAYRLRARYPVRAAVPPSSAYEYYTPGVRADATGAPAEIEVK